MHDAERLESRPVKGNRLIEMSAEAKETIPAKSPQTIE